MTDRFPSLFAALAALGRSMGVYDVEAPLPDERLGVLGDGLQNAERRREDSRIEDSISRSPVDPSASSTAPSYSGEESRGHPRASAAGHASISILGGPRTQDGRVINMSRSGVLLDTSPVAIGTRVRTEISGLKANGTVVREIAGLSVRSSPGVAVRFDEIQDSIGRSSA